MAGSRTLKLSILADVDNLKKNLDSGSKEVEGFGGKLEKFSKVAAAAFAAAATAAAAYAGKLAIEGVKAAIEDEAAQKRLATALENVTGATEAQIAAIEEQILQTSLATGVADDKLRPALQRLAVATGSVEKSQELLSLALDISAATGKDVESVSLALAKAYDGNLGSLTRLGVGISAAEAKTLGFEGVVQQLSDTFGGSAKTQAETFEGRIARLNVAFDEAKESVGTALLPIIEKLLTFITNTVIPGFTSFKESAIDPVITAIKNNKGAFEGLYNFAKDTLVPFLTGNLVNAIKVIATVASGIVSAVGIALRALEPIINAAIAGINLVIRGINLIKPGPDIATIGKVDFSNSSKSTGSNTVSSASLPAGVKITTPSVPSATTPTVTTVTPVVPSTPTNTTPTVTSTSGVSAGTTVSGSFNAGRFRMGEEASMAGVTINVNAPSVIDEDGFSRAIVSALNSVQDRTGGGGGGLRGIQLVQ